MKEQKPIQVTEPFLPPLEEYIEYLKGIWDRNLLTNQGPLVKELELKLQAYLEINMPVHCVANGSLGLSIALKALGVKGEVITTPFSYVATTSCPLWEGCSVKFADIESDTLTIDPRAVEAAISSKTEAILATHVFGNPCDVEVLDAIGEKYGLAVIYDAAHAFGVTFKGKSILGYGDASMVSLHATKLFHTVEGGFVVAKDPIVSEKIEWMRRFGHNGFGEFHGIGFNAKMSEIHAAMGLVNLNHIERCIQIRKSIIDQYTEGVKNNNFIYPAFQPGVNTGWNYSYFPVLFVDERELIECERKLIESNIYPRRYFYPSLNKCGLSNENVNECPNSEDISSRILCLPLSLCVSKNDICKVIQILSNNYKK